jgi:DNA polymerase-3 subunit gamma/tau
MAMPDETASPPLTGEATGYQVVARRYRPQLFADLVGQEHVARGLSGAIESGRIGHAYLFTGARGVGKTSAARIYAKALNCEKGPASEPCNECDACRAITAGQDVDVVEIDAASNRGIDEIRQLRQNVAVRPARGRFKVYIIDEVHMLTREAFNALLKTLEEPPAHVKFVFCTTEPEKLPITILSRCQRFDFVTVEAPAIARRLAQIVESERADVTAEALHLIARRAAGSMRDSQSLLEQLLGAATGPITVDDVHAVIGTGSDERIGELLAAIAARDAARGIATLDVALAGGADPGGVIEQLLAALRDCLMASVGCKAEMLAHAEGLGVDVPAIGRDLGTGTILAMMQIVDQSLGRMRTSGHAAVLAEMAIVRLATLEDLENLSSALERVTVAAGGGASSAGTSVGPASASREKKTTHLTGAARAEPAVPPVSERRLANAVVPTDEEGGPRNESSSLLAAPVPMIESPTPAPRQLPANASAVWHAATATLEGLVGDFAGTVSAAAWKDDVLELTLPAEATAAAAFLGRPDSQATIAAALENEIGRPVRHAIMVAPAVARPAAKAAVAPAQSQAALMKTAMDHPLVSHVRTLFDAAVRKVEPLRAGERRVAAAAPVAMSDGQGDMNGVEDRDAEL